IPRRTSGASAIARSSGMVMISLQGDGRATAIRGRASVGRAVAQGVSLGGTLTPLPFGPADHSRLLGYGRAGWYDRDMSEADVAEILKLPPEERMRLAEILWAS